MNLQRQKPRERRIRERAVLVGRAVPGILATGACVTMIHVLEMSMPLPWLVTLAIVVLATA